MTERQELLAEAEELGLDFAKNAKTENIRKAVTAAIAEAAVDEARSKTVESIDEPTLAESLNIEVSAPAVETQSEMEARLQAQFDKKLAVKLAEVTVNVEKNVNRQSGVPLFGKPRVDAMRKATKLVRCIVTCRDPLKQSWEGEIISVANDVIGEQKKFVPFNLTEGYHLPQIIVNVLKSKKCTVFVNKKINGEQVKVGKSIDAYGIEILDALTKQELDELASEQRARRSIDEN